VPRFISRPTPNGICMEAFLVATMVVGLAKIGDKTQILSLMLATHFQRPLPIIFGIFFATIANHSAAGLAGTYFGSLLSGPWMRSILGVSFLSVAIWALFPDKYEGNKTAISRSGRLFRRSSPSSLPRSVTRRRSRPSARRHGLNTSLRS
jgi:putative Ca2+/H+ antiporter (TMEM165/GDT1 family)